MTVLNTSIIAGSLETTLNMFDDTSSTATHTILMLLFSSDPIATLSESLISNPVLHSPPLMLVLETAHL